MNSSAFSIIKWQSSGKSVTFRRDFTTGGPIVRLGTKCPSMISTWITLAPPWHAARTWSPSRAKSAERIDGASSIKPGPQSVNLKTVVGRSSLVACGQRLVDAGLTTGVVEILTCGILLLAPGCQLFQDASCKPAIRKG